MAVGYINGVTHHQGSEEIINISFVPASGTEYFSVPIAGVGAAEEIKVLGAVVNYLTAPAGSGLFTIAIGNNSESSNIVNAEDATSDGGDITAGTPKALTLAASNAVVGIASSLIVTFYTESAVDPVGCGGTLSIRIARQSNTGVLA